MSQNSVSYSIRKAIDTVSANAYIDGRQPSAVRMNKSSISWLREECGDWFRSYAMDNGARLMYFDNWYGRLRVYEDNAIPDGKVILLVEIPPPPPYRGEVKVDVEYAAGNQE